MTRPTVLVLGSSGMLGSMLVRVLADELGPAPVAATHRPNSRPAPCVATTAPFDAATDDPSAVLDDMGSPPWVVNAIGRIKPHINEASSSSRRVAIELNALLPHRLAEAAERIGVGVLMVGTDAVFSGRGGPYSESSPPDPTDLYGATKSLGEVVSDRVMHLRTSIIGPELGSQLSLLEWFLGQPDGASIPGFVNNLWNGVTTLHLAKLVAGIVRSEAFDPGVHHTVPADSVSKFELLAVMREAFDRRITITPQRADTDIDRRLHTEDPTANARRWSAAGYDQLPTVREMVAELESYMHAADVDFSQ